MAACGGGGGGGGDGTIIIENSPIADIVTANGDEDIASIVVILGGSDGDGTIASFTLESLPVNGFLYSDDQLTLPVFNSTKYLPTTNTLTLYFAPAGDFNGSTSFDYFATDNDDLDSTVVPVTIVVNPVNDEPVLVNNKLSINEGQTKIVTEQEISATDVDNDELTYIISNVDNGQFERVSEAGLRITQFTQAEVSASKIQFVHDNSEQAPSFSLALSDSIVTKEAVVADIVYNSVNDNPPVFTSTDNVNVSENTIAVLTLAAFDLDSNTLDYSIVPGGADNSLFSLNDRNLIFKIPPDYETPLDVGGNNIYEVMVGVFDGISMTTQQISVSVLNLNDNSPVLTSATAISIAENNPIVQTLTAVDADQNTVIYSIVSGGVDNGLFNISKNVLSFISAPDYENPLDVGRDNTYTVNIGVSDGVNVTTQPVTVTITNINDSPPIYTSSTAVSVIENVTSVQTVTATDDDTPILIYSLISGSGGEDNALFVINGTSGVMSFNTAPDYEVPLDNNADNVYQVKVGVSDGVSTVSQSVTVTVTNENDNTPIFTSLTSVNSSENIITILTVTATDGDDDVLTYSLDSGLGGDDNSLVSINSSSGDLVFVLTPDFEAPGDSNIDNVYQVRVGVSDGVTTTYQAIAITITNANDNIPVITSADTVTIKEETNAVLTVTATDDDDDSLNYSLMTGSGGEDNAQFYINNATGQLSFIDDPEYDEPEDTDEDNNYKVLVAVTDGLNTTTQEIIITVSLVSFPYIEDFGTGSDGWVIVDDYSNLSSWAVNSGVLEQSLDYGISSVTRELDETYHRGTYAYLMDGLSLSNYRVSADLTPIEQPGYSFLDDGHDIGLMFRYQDNDNYYRIVLNSEYGYSRLDRKFEGVFNTLAADARGYLGEGIAIHVEVEVKGDLIQVYIDGEARFAVKDDKITSGSVALYTEDGAQFDNITLDNNSITPAIVINEPAAFTAIPDSIFFVSAVAVNVPASASVSFEIDGNPCGATTEVSVGYFTSTCNVSIAGEHSIQAKIEDNIILASDTNSSVGSSAEVRLIVGDSISNGVSDTVSDDNFSIDGKVIGEQGYAGVLQDLLTGSKSLPQMIYNEAVPGDESWELDLRLFSIMERHPETTAAHVMIGTNDTGRSMPIPSGLGCSGASCNGTYKENIQNIIDTLNAASITPVIAYIPPVFKTDNPLTETRNVLTQEYNVVLATELSIQALGPDFYTYFLSADENRLSLFSDTLHFNGLGYVVMAHLWDHYLNGNTSLPSRGQLPLVLEDICVRIVSFDCQDPLQYKQDLMQLGNPYYIDESYEIQSIPSLLDGGVWLRTANSEKSNLRSDYLSFTVDRNVEVFVAYDASAIVLPPWFVGFTDTGLTITVSNPITPTMKLYKKTFVLGVDTLSDGTILLGGNISGGAIGVNSNYVVIIKSL